MKILIKSNSAAKLYSQEISYNGLSKFIEGEFPETKNWSLSFTDLEGDQIMVSSDADLDIMKEVLKGKDYIKMSLSTEGEETQSSPAKAKKENKEKPEKKVKAPKKVEEVKN